MTIIQHRKTIIKANAPKQFKRKFSMLLRQLMVEHEISSINKEFLEGFEDKLKSNLYYLIDNYFEVMK